MSCVPSTGRKIPKASIPIKLTVESLKQKTFKGTLWSTLERFSVQGIAFVVMIIMARILTPDDYGLVGMLAVFIAVSQSLVDSGFSQASSLRQ